MSAGTGSLELARGFARHANLETTARICSHLVQEDVDKGATLLPGNGEYEGKGRDKASALQKRIAELEAQLAVFTKAVSAAGDRPVRNGRAVGGVST